MNNFKNIMKTMSIVKVMSLGVFLFLFGLVSLGHATGDRVAMAPNQIKTYKNQKKSEYTITKTPDITYFGIIPKALRSSKPFELFNPFAPKSYGYGRDMVSWSAKEGKPKGFILAGIRFW
jgi:hypothetical protein